MSNLKVGMIRYGVMCRPDGMVFDDGTAIRLAPDRYLVTTTTGNAAAVLDWMEEWHQTEWPELRVHCASVTEQWATVALVGPAPARCSARSRPDRPSATTTSRSWPGGTRSSPVSRQGCAGSASPANSPTRSTGHRGEALALWEALYEAGAPFGITPYGTETMHVLRAEKGYPIIGQDTDGTVTPQDLGMSWGGLEEGSPTSSASAAYARADAVRPDRKHLVGLLPDDPAAFLPEGTQLIADSVLPAPPVPMLGHVTSSYRSAALEPHLRPRPDQGRPGPHRRAPLRPRG
ncbi:hypothetical protein ACRAWF_35325 [Streptomyces sp. L7]